MADKNNQTGEQENLSQLLQIRRDKLKELQDSGNDPFTITRYVTDNDSANIKDNFDSLEGKEVSIAGRLMSKRGMGKVSFCDLQDKSGRIQLYARRDEMDEETYNRFKKYDIGDIVGVKGVVSVPSGARCLSGWWMSPFCPSLFFPCPKSFTA